MKQDLSALVDAESPAGSDTQALLSKVGTDHGLRESWELYHLIGDTLRGTSGEGIGRTAFAARLAAEPTVIGPAAAPLSAARKRAARSRWMMPLAASLAAIGFVGWMASALLPQQSGEQTLAVNPASKPVAVVSSPEAAPAPASAPAAAAAPAGNTVTVAAPSIALPPAAIPIAHDVDDYLWAHQRFAPAASAYRVRPARHEAR